MIDMTTSTTALLNDVDLDAVAGLTDAVRSDPATASTDDNAGAHGTR